MTLHKYRVIKTIASTGSFTKAGELLNMTQSAISHAVKSLESDIGLTLIKRQHSKIELTSEAKYLMTFIEDLLFTEAKLNQEINKLLEPTSGTIRIGCYSSASSKVLPPIIRRHQLLYPNITIEIQEGNYRELKQLLDSDSIDVTFLAEEFIEANYVSNFCFQDKMMFVIGSEFSDIRDKRVPFSIVENYPFILPNHSCANFIYRLFERYGITPKISYQIQSNDTVFSMVENGIGATVISETSIATSKYKVKAYPFTEEVKRNTYLVAKKGLVESSTIIQAFLKVANDSVTEY